MKFTVEIELGNEAMQTPLDVVEALSRVKIGVIRQCSDPIRRWPNGLSGAPQPVMDDNGNTVGNWTLHE